jgi:hypothetical protein
MSETKFHTRAEPLILHWVAQTSDSQKRWNQNCMEVVPLQ